MDGKKIYVGCSLIQATEDFGKKVEEFKNKLREKYEVLDFIGLETGSDQDIFEWNTKCVLECDIFVAICDYPSIGLGYELGVALENNVVTLAFALENANVSRMVLGVTGKDYDFFRYESFDDIVEKIDERASKL